MSQAKNTGVRDNDTLATGPKISARASASRILFSLLLVLAVLSPLVSISLL